MQIHIFGSLLAPSAFVVAVAELGSLGHSTRFMEKVIIFLIPMVLTIPTAILFCWFRSRRKLRVSFGTVFFSAFVVTFFWLGFATHWEIYTVRFWDGSLAKAPDRGLFLRIIAMTIIMCALPALGVVHYYQRRSKRDETPVA